MIGEGIRSKSTGIYGWHTEAEEDALIALAKKYVPEKDGVIVELGGEYGKSAAEFAFASRDKQGTRIVTVDLFPDNHHIAGQHGGLFQVWQQNIAESGVAGANLYMIPVRGVSWEVGNNWNEEADLLFIDAGHTFEEVSKDISAWLRHVKPGGAVIFHDYAKDENAHPLHHEVKRAVDGYFDNPGIKKGYWLPLNLPDSLTGFERNPKFKEAAENVPSKTVESRASADQAETKTAKAKPATKTGKRNVKSTKK